MFAAVYRPRPDLGPRFDGKLILKVAHSKKVSGFLPVSLVRLTLSY